MAFCPTCGAAVEGKFCGKCGSPVTETAAPNVGQAPPAGAAPTAAPGLTENVASALCYVLGLITGILFLVLAPYNQNRNIRFHAFQSIFLHVGWILLIIIESIITASLPFALYIIASILNLVVFLGGFVIWIYMLISAYQGKRVKLPVIGDLAEKQAYA
jgi:uncharacterized membrane protein